MRSTPPIPHAAARQNGASSPNGDSAVASVSSGITQNVKIGMPSMLPISE